MKPTREVEALCEAIAAEGLIVLGQVPLGVEPEFPRFVEWLEAGWHAGMAFLEQHLGLREDPRGLHPGAESALVVALPYRQRRGGAAAARPRIAAYAQLRDYHKLLRPLLARLARSVAPELRVRVVTDSAPVLERALAQRTGEGFIGKNTCFIHPRHGSFLLLAEVLLSVPAPHAAASTRRSQELPRSAAGGCGTCRRCQVHCPTGALDEAYRLDARKCLAYWTIEHRGAIPPRFWPWLAEFVFGCDICQQVCPYNRSGSELTRPEWVRLTAPPDLLTMATMDQTTYERLFAGTSMTRARRSGLRRNALLALYVTGDARFHAALESCAADADEELSETVRQLQGAIGPSSSLT